MAMLLSLKGGVGTHICITDNNEQGWVCVILFVAGVITATICGSILKRCSFTMHCNCFTLSFMGTNARPS